MITTGQLRILAKEYISKITRPDVISPDDIRWLKSGNGIFPRKHVIYESEFKETPYTADDTFILFDVLQEKNIASERIGDKVKSQLPFKIIINIYGKAAEDEIQHLMAHLHTFEVRLWMLSNKVSLVWEPEEFQVLDGRENASWWIRRRIELKLNTEQDIEYDSGLSAGDDIDLIARHIEFEGR